MTNMQLPAAMPMTTSSALLEATRDGLPANWWLMGEAWDALERLCRRFASSSMVPEDFKGNPDNVFVALVAGLPLGLSPLACLQSIAVINGRPTLWGDAPVAQVLAHPTLEDHSSAATGTIEAGTRCWTVTIKRRMRGGVVTTERSYSIADAKLAGLWGKTGYNGKPTPWVTSPDRMLFNRARAFALRDSFADVLKGVRIEADDSESEQPLRVVEHKITATISKTPEQMQVVEMATLAPPKAAPAPMAPPAETPQPAKRTRARKEPEAAAPAPVAQPEAAAEPEPEPEIPAGEPVEQAADEAPADAARELKVTTVTNLPITEDCGLWFEAEATEEPEQVVKGDIALRERDGAIEMLQFDGSQWGKAHEHDAALSRAHAALRRDLSQWAKTRNWDAVKTMAWARDTLKAKTTPMTFQALTLKQLADLSHAREHQG
jgi:hypothetical protein